MKPWEISDPVARQMAQMGDDGWVPETTNGVTPVEQPADMTPFDGELARQLLGNEMLTDAEVEAALEFEQKG